MFNKTNQSSLFANSNNTNNQMNSNRLFGSGQKNNTFSVGVSSNNAKATTPTGLFGNATTTPTNISAFNPGVQGQGQGQQNISPNIFQPNNNSSNNLFANQATGNTLMGVKSNFLTSNGNTANNMLSTPVKSNTHFLSQNPSNLTFAPTSNNVFNNNNQNSNANVSLFNSNTNTNTNTNIFGINSSAPNTNTNVNIIGTNNNNPTNMNSNTNIFAQNNNNPNSINATNTNSNMNLFGNQATNANTQLNLFSGNVASSSNTSNNTNLFGNNNNLQSNSSNFNQIQDLQKGTFNYQFNPLKTKENEPGSNKTGDISFMNLISQPQFSGKLLEELRYEDYNLKKGGLANNNKTNQIFALNNSNTTSNTLNFNSMNNINNSNNQTVGLFSNINSNTLQQGGQVNPQSNTANNSSTLFNTQSNPSNNPPNSFNTNKSTSNSGLFGNAAGNSNNTSLFSGNLTQGVSNVGATDNKSSGLGLFSNVQSNTTTNTANPTGGLFANTNNPQSQQLNGLNFSFAGNSFGGSNDSKGLTQINQPPISHVNEMNTLQNQLTVPAPSNILGVDVSSLSSLVKDSVCKDKKLKDFVTEFENEFEKSEFKHGTSGIYNKISLKSIANPIEDYHLRYSHFTYKPNKASSHKLSDYDYYASIMHKKSLQFNYNQDSLLNIKRNRFNNSLIYKEREDNLRDTNYDFNRNVIEIRRKFTRRDKKEFCGLNGALREEDYIHNHVNYKQENEINEIITIDNEKSINNDKVIKILVEIKNIDNIDTLSINLNKNNQVKLLKEYIIEKIKSRNIAKLKKISLANLTLIKSNSLMKDNKLISDYDLHNNDKITATISTDGDEIEYPYQYENNNSIPILKKSRIPNKIQMNEIAPEECLPTITKQGYNTIPDIKIINRMTIEELKNVKNFEIYNQYGRIKWNDGVNLTGLNLNDIVEINDANLNLYQGSIKLPTKGEGLNKPFTISIKVFPSSNVDMNDEIEKEDFIESLKIYVNKAGGEFINYDEENNFLIFSCKEIKQ